MSRRAGASDGHMGSGGSSSTGVDAAMDTAIDTMADVAEDRTALRLVFISDFDGSLRRVG